MVVKKMLEKKYKLGNYYYDIEIIKNRVIKYNKSIKGTLKRKEWNEKNKEKMKKWYSIYNKRKKVKAIQNGYCLICYKQPVFEDYKACYDCIKKRYEKKVANNESKIK